MRKLKKSEYFLAAVLALVAAFPLAVQQPSDVPVTATVATIQQQQALNNHSDYRQNLRDYQKATQICIELRAEGKDVTCPNVNDYNAIQHFLNGDYSAALHAAASATGTTRLQMSDLTDFQQNLLRWYQRINSCPQALQDSMPGFYDLCQSMLNPFVPTSQGWRNLYQGVNGDQSATLNDIIDANKGVNRTH